VDSIQKGWQKIYEDAQKLIFVKQINNIKIMNMNYTFLLLTFFCVSIISCPAQKTDCKSFKIGKFELNDKENNVIFYIERNDSIQTETNSINQDIAKFRITWTNDCEYKLQLLAGTKQMKEFFGKRNLNIIIIETYQDSYKFSASLDGFNEVRYQTIKKVE
jgi:hypothetical protein